MENLCSEKALLPQHTLYGARSEHTIPSDVRHVFWSMVIEKTMKLLQFHRKVFYYIWISIPVTISQKKAFPSDYVETFGMSSFEVSTVFNTALQKLLGFFQFREKYELYFITSNIESRFQIQVTK